MRCPTVPLLDVIARTGREIVKRHYSGPCPACLKEKHSDGKPVLYVGRLGWHCYSCGAKGDAVALAAYHLGYGPPVRGQAFRAVMAWLESGSTSVPSVAAEEEDAPVRIDPTSALRNAVPLEETPDPRLRRWLEERSIPLHAPARWLDDYDASWWPGYSRWWPLVVPACTGLGRVVSMHGRAVDKAAPRKTTWPYGAEARELLFATPQARRVLAGEETVDALAVVEGLPDYLTFASVTGIPTVAGTSGSFRALRISRIAPKTNVFVGTHDDGPGRRYMREVADALPNHLVRPLPLRRVGRAA